MACHTSAPFETIEGAKEYLDLLAKEIDETERAVLSDIDSAEHSPGSRHTDALRLASYHLAKLATHVKISRRLLNDLRSLRRLLHKEKQSLAA